jgi:TolA-binding protein
MKSKTRYRCSVGGAPALAAMICSVLLVAVEALAGQPTLMPHEKYITEYRRLGSLGKTEEREELGRSFLAEAQAYITEHPEGPGIVQAKLNKALAIGLYGERRDAEAEKLLKEIESAYPVSPLLPEVMYYHAWLLEFAPGRMRHEEKRAIALELVERFPKSEKAPYALALAGYSYLVDAGDPKTAGVLCQRVVREYPGTGAELNARRDLIRMAADAGDIASVQEQVDAFLHRFDEAPEIVPPGSWASLLCRDVGASCMRIEDWGRAEQTFQKATENCRGQENEVRARSQLIHLAINRGDEASALAKIDELIDRYSTIPEGMPPAVWAGLLNRELADACVRVGAWSRAEECYKAVLRVLPEDHAAVEARLGLARILRDGFDGERVQESVSVLLDLIRKDPRSAEAPRALIQAADCCEWYVPNKERAAELLERVIAEYPGTHEELEARVRLIVLALYANEREVAEERIRSFDRLLEAETNAGRAGQGQLLIARALKGFYTNNLNRTEFRDRAIARLDAIPRTRRCCEEASEALLDLALHYSGPRDRDAEKAKQYALQLLAENPERNRERYARCVSEIMQDRLLLLEPLRQELPQRAQAVLSRQCGFTSAEQHSFLLKADSFYGAEALEKMAREIIVFGREHDDPQLVEDAMLFVAESYLRKEQAREALRHLAAIAEAGVQLSSADELRFLETRAFSHLWCDKASMSIADLEELVARAPEPDAGNKGQLRTKAYYEYWLAVAWFWQRQYTQSRRLFDLLVQRYPRTPWAERAAQYMDCLAPLVGDGSL